jgi:predicted transcriptional regulator
MEDVMNMTNRNVPLLVPGNQQHDLTTWHDDFSALLHRLPDHNLAAELKADIAARMHSRLRMGERPPLTLLSADKILTFDWPEPAWAVPQLLPAGLTILAGQPKIGKSWLALQIAQAVGAGGVALGQPVERGRVLYLALEDTPRRLKARMQKQNWPAGLQVDFLVLGQFSDELGDLRDGGGERLARQLGMVGYRLVVIDTLSRAITGDQNDVQAMTSALTPIQEIAHVNNCAVLLVDHHRKIPGSDAVADILGSTAKGAMADTVWGLYRERGKAGAKLAIIGREVEEQTLALRMDWETGCWQVEGDANEIEMTERRQEILDMLAELGPAGVLDIAKAIGQDKGNVHKRLQDLVNAGLVNKSGKGKGSVVYELVTKE